MQITIATKHDATALESLYARSYGTLLKPDYPTDLLDRALPLLCRVNPALIEAGSYYVARNLTGTIIGAGGWSLAEPGSGMLRSGHVHLRHFAVDPDMARCGIGRMLFEACRAAASEARVFECFSTRTAVPFYSSLGFKLNKEINIEMNPDLAFPSIHMIQLA